MRAFHKGQQTHDIIFADTVFLIDQHLHEGTCLQFSLHDTVSLACLCKFHRFSGTFHRVIHGYDFRQRRIKIQFLHQPPYLIFVTNQDRAYHTILCGSGNRLQSVLIVGSHHCHGPLYRFVFQHFF